MPLVDSSCGRVVLLRRMVVAGRTPVKIYHASTL